MNVIPYNKFGNWNRRVFEILIVISKDFQLQVTCNSREQLIFAIEKFNTRFTNQSK